jgi:alpha-L-fucosidase 2
MYEEGNSPVVETPLSAAQSLHDMMFTGWGGVIRVFPGVPSSWSDLTVHNVAVEGAFLLSAVRRDGVTQFVRIKSLAGEPCRLAPGFAGPYDVARLTSPGTGLAWRELGAGVLELDLAIDDEVVIRPKGAMAQLTIEPAPTGNGNVWGLP